jgi:hypothetical protein
VSGKLLVPIVEGPGDVEAVPVLLRRVLVEKGRFDLGVAKPVRCPRSALRREEKWLTAVRYACMTPGCAAIIALWDADDDCPKHLGPALVTRGVDAAAGTPFAAILAHREYEAWFLGSLESLRGVRGILPTAQTQLDPEAIRGAKECLAREMGGGKYRERDDQPALTARFDLHLARANCPSFDKFLRDVDGLLARLGAPQPDPRGNELVSGEKPLTAPLESA